MRLPSRPATVPATAAVLAGLLLTAGCSGTSATPTSAATAPPVTAAGTSPAVSGTGSPAPPGGASPAGASPASPRPTSPAARKPAPEGTRGTDVFAGDRRILLLPVGSEATLGVLDSGKIGLTEAFDDRALFVLTRTRPGGDRFWIRTAELRRGGEALCLSAKLGTGGRPAPVTTVACDASAEDQLFRFRRAGGTKDKPRYTIRTGTDTYLVQDPTGEIAGTGTGVAAVAIGEGTPDIDTPFLLADRGRASMPTLG